MFIDNLELTLIAGDGGNGVIAWRREKFVPKGGPAGGDGGTGGSIIIEADRHLLSLEDLRHIKILKAKNGQQGGSANKSGKRGEDLIVKVPLGTIVKDKNTHAILYDFTKDKEKALLCQGGNGGKGNSRFKSSTNQAPNKCTPGKPGETKAVVLELKLIADIGLVGMPNAGKSTLMQKLTDVQVKIAPYPFTTLRPNLGLIEFDDFSRLLIADIPGIIKDASQNKGLGFAFLKHIERTSTLVFVIDLSAEDGRDPAEDFSTLVQELKKYKPEMLEKPFLVVLNKIDKQEALDHLDSFLETYPFDKKAVFTISAATKEGFEKFIPALKTLAQKTGKKFI